MRHAVAMFFMMGAAATALLSSAGEPAPQGSPEEQILRSAGLNADGDALLEFFRERTQPRADLDKLLALARQLGDANAQTRARAAAKLVAVGPWAVPPLRHVANELDNPLAAQEARHCLEWVEGQHSKDLPIAAARLLAARKPAAAAEALLAFLPRADDQAVVDGVKAALATIAARPGKADAALLAALQDPLPLRRAVAVEVLACSGHPELLPEIRKLLADPMPQVRLRAALALTQRDDEIAVAVLIDLLAELPADERRLAEQSLQQLAGDWSPAPALQGDDEFSRKVRREAWAGWWRTMDGPTLLAAFRQRMSSVSEETQKLPAVAPRLLAVRKPAGASEALLAFLPLTDDRVMQEAIGKALKSLALVNGKPDPVLLKALSDPLPMLRLAAAEALAGGGDAALPAVRKLLTDANQEVRLRVALALVRAHDKEAVPALIGLVAELPRDKAWDADELLRRLAGAKAPAVPAGDDVAARKKVGAAWQAWWKEHGAAVDMAELDNARGGAALTIVAEIINVAKAKAAKKAGKAAQVLPAGQPIPGNPFGNPFGNPSGSTPRLVALDRNSQVRWQIDNLDNPVDFQILPGDRVLIAEYGGNRVTERDLKGKILWEKALPGSPVNVQRLANGNTFVALYDALGSSLLVEIDPQGKVTLLTLPGLGGAIGGFGGPAGGGFGGFGKGAAGGGGFGGGGFGGFNPNSEIRAAHKMADGQIVCLLGDGSCVRLDATGQETKRFAVPRAYTIMGNIDVTPKGNILFVQTDNAIAEYDADGKTVWQAKIAGSGRATRLANGNTLVTSNIAGVVELDNTGRTVWQYQPPAGFQALRARQWSGATASSWPGFNGAVPAPKAEYGGIDPNVVAAWEKAGAKFGWMAPDSTSVAVSFAEAPPGDPMALPGFWIRGAIQQGTVVKLPAPTVPFGLHFNVAGATKGKKGNMTDAALQELAGLKQLRALYLRANQVTDVGIKQLVGLKQLQVLDLSHTQVGDAGLKELAGLQQLQTLRLGGLANVTDKGLMELAGLKQVQFLAISGTQVTDKGLKELAGLKQLQTLRLDSTNVTDAGLKELLGLKQLQTLDLTGTSVTAAGVAELQKALPKLQIVRDKAKDKAKKV